MHSRCRLPLERQVYSCLRNELPPFLSLLVQLPHGTGGFLCGSSSERFSRRGAALEVITPGEPGPTASGAAPDPARTAAIARACHAAGLLTLTCGTYGNVLRFLPPLVAGDDDLRRGLEIVDGALLLA